LQHTVVLDTILTDNSIT